MSLTKLPLNLKVALSYALFGGLWILLSDHLLAALIRDPGMRTNLQTIKGWAFVALSAVLIDTLLRRHLALNRQAEQALRTSEERYRQLFEHSLDAILLTAPDGRIDAANPAACRIFQCSEHELQRLGRNGMVDTNDPRLEPALAERERNGKFAGELTFQRGDGSTFEGEVSTVCFTNSAGQTRTSMIIRDITERKRAEQALQESHQQLQSLTARLSKVEERERHNLARELHDRVGQSLTALSINLSIVQSQLSTASAQQVGMRLAESFQLIDETVERVRDVMANLYPPVLADYGLAAALRWYGERFSRHTVIAVQVEARGAVETRLPASLETVLFRVAQEALNNAARHAQPRQIMIELALGATTQLRIQDDGRGFDPAQATTTDENGGWGLRTMRERVEAVGGSFALSSAPGQGTTICAQVTVPGLS